MEQEKTKIFALVTKKDENENSVKRKRKKSQYKKISNKVRQNLIEMVYLKDYLLKDAASILGINYSTAKTILRIFRLEKRIEKKNSDEDKDNQVPKTSDENSQHFGKSVPNETEDTQLQQTELPSSDPTKNFENIKDDNSLLIFKSKVREFNCLFDGCMDGIKNNQILLNKTAAMMIKLVSLMKLPKQDPTTSRDFSNQHNFLPMYATQNVFNTDPNRSFQFFQNY